MTLSDKEAKLKRNYNLLTQCNNGEISQVECARLLELSPRQIKRKCKLLRDNHNNIDGLLRKKSAKPPANKVSEALRTEIIECCKTKFYGYGPTIVNEEFELLYGVKLSIETTRQIMIAGGVWHPKVKKVKRIHGMRARVSCYGELVQVDGTEYDWFGNGIKYVMLVFIDDATSSLLHAELVKSESIVSYMQAMTIYLKTHGRPMCLYTDKHVVFRVNMPSAPDDSQTQFARAMESLDIKMIQANSPQAKGRVERANQTLQGRVPVKFKQLGITTVEQANKYLQETYLTEYNKKFAVEPSSPVNAHRELATEHDLDIVLAVHKTRVISKNHTVQYENQVVQILEEPQNLHKKLAKIISKNGVVTQVLVNNKNVKFLVLKKRPKQFDVSCGKMLNGALRDINHQAGFKNKFGVDGFYYGKR